jgi:hypothetical protein
MMISATGQTSISPAISLGRDDVAIRPSRHQAILHLAARGQLVSEPQPYHQQHHRDGEASYGATSASALFGIGHRLATPATNDVHIAAFRLFYHPSSAKNNDRFTLPALFWWLPAAGGCTPLPVTQTLLFCPGASAKAGFPHNKQESDKAPSMSGFKEPSFADRQKAAQQARQDILNKFRSQPGPDDPAVKQRQAEREALATERTKAKLAREAEKAEQKRREQEAAAEAAAQLAREQAEAAEKEAALEVERKAARDARYAARKKKKR